MIGLLAGRDEQRQDFLAESIGVEPGCTANVSFCSTHPIQHITDRDESMPVETPPGRRRGSLCADHLLWLQDSAVLGTACSVTVILSAWQGFYKLSFHFHTACNVTSSAMPIKLTRGNPICEALLIAVEHSCNVSFLAHTPH